MGVVEYMNEWLPSRAAKVITAVAGACAIAAFSLLPQLEPLLPSMSAKELLLARLLLATVTLLFLALVVLGLVLHHYKKADAAYKSKPIVMTDLRREILDILFNIESASVSDMNHALKRRPQHVLHELEELETMDLVYSYMALPEMGWSLTHSGRAYALKHFAVPADLE